MSDEKTGNGRTQTLIPFTEFLESGAFNIEYWVSGFWENARMNDPRLPAPQVKQAPIVSFYCPTCEGSRRFKGEWKFPIIELGHHNDIIPDFLVYLCRDCQTYHKTFSLQTRNVQSGNSFVVKIGEYPDESVSIPPAMREIAGSDYKYIVNGLKSENKGYGIGALAYYRRVVENQKDKLIDQLIKVVKLEGKESDVKLLEDAKNNYQFKQAMEMIADHIPISLFIAEKNPLKVLHNALSEGVHALEDDVCLTKAKAVRIVLFALSIRLREILKEQNTLKKAILELDSIKDEKP